jgi:hypothetical protein
VTCRCRVCSTFASVAEVVRSGSIRRVRTGSGRRSGSWNSGTVHAVRREANRTRASEESRSARGVGTKSRLSLGPGDPKRVKRHEARHSPAVRAKARKAGTPARSSGARSLKSGLFARRFGAPRDETVPFSGGGFRAISIPASRSRRSAAVRVEIPVRRVEARVVSSTELRRGRR